MFSKTALNGLKVVDISRVLAGPYASQILSDHGAEVIKIEPPQGDETRGWGPPFHENGDAAYYQGINRNKQSISLNLSHPKGQEILFKLLEDADVLIENFKMGTMDKWGIGYESCLQKKFPKLIYCNITGFGKEGPLAGKVGYDALTQAMSGIASINGYPDKPPCRVGMPIVDLVTGLYLVIAALMALQERERSGIGQKVDLSLYNSALSILIPQAYNWIIGQKEPKRCGYSHPNIAPYSHFYTKTCMIFVGCGNDRQFTKFCAEIDHPDIAEDSRFVSNAKRLENYDELMASIQKILLEMDGEDLSDRLINQGIPAGKVTTVGETLQHPQTYAENMLIETDDYTGIQTPIQFSRSESMYQNAPPQFAEHTESVLSNLGYSDEEISKLVTDKVIYK